ncbi:hypothetical protein ACE3MS_08575 [Paenibacillus dendritiformis]|uniref:hypothetical protein n=1 Tax=Paenibacillaceae TaxID=186822 RepID=UPI000EDF4B32|nr:hypothetical protein [Paenibacillus macerans]MBS5910717.1 hypothetical protein [Paenibacillus macerans]MDU7472294.1 hypothetical protein [Paenibacillus macerans]GBK61311.1 hypothetical protein PbDSM24746_13150 [Paenibacillus macerans]GBK67613.1 hypothetical protein PbJCM17693_13210 [Paenibacillus macerans]
MNSISKVFAALIAVLLLYLYPISAAFDQQDDISELVVLKATTTFVDAVRDKGFVSPSMYTDFMEAIAATGNTFDVQMEHGSKKYVPVYDDPTRPDTFRGSYEVHYDMFYNAQILPVLFPNSAAAKDDPARRYKLRVGDTFAVTVKNTNRTPGTILFDFLNQAISPNEKIFIPYGGVVRNEAD